MSRLERSSRRPAGATRSRPEAARAAPALPTRRARQRVLPEVPISEIDFSATGTSQNTEWSPDESIVDHPPWVIVIFKLIELYSERGVSKSILINGFAGEGIKKSPGRWKQ